MALALDEARPRSPTATCRWAPWCSSAARSWPGANEREATGDPTAHAEVLACCDAAAALGRWRLDDATLVVTLEPCACAPGAAVNARLGRLVFGAPDLRPAPPARSTTSAPTPPNHEVPSPPACADRGRRPAHLLLRRAPRWLISRRGRGRYGRRCPAGTSWRRRRWRPGSPGGRRVAIAASSVAAGALVHRPPGHLAEGPVGVDEERDRRPVTAP